MALWLQHLHRCLHWVSSTLFADRAGTTQVLERRTSILDTTEVVSCVPTIRMPAMGSLPTMRRAEKRQTMRYPCNLEAHCFKQGCAGEPVKGRLRNLSVGGVGLVVATRVEPGETLVLELDKTFEVEHRIIAVTIVHVRPMPIRGWFLGCALAQELADQQVRTIVARSSRT